MDLDNIIDLLNEHHQRASYGAVAGFLGVAPIGLMGNRPQSYEDSWVVAAANNPQASRRRGWPTGYADDQIDPECLRQIHERLNDFIEAEDDLRQWLIQAGRP